MIESLMIPVAIAGVFSMIMIPFSIIFLFVKGQRWIAFKSLVLSLGVYFTINLFVVPIVDGYLMQGGRIIDGQGNVYQIGD